MTTPQRLTIRLFARRLAEREDLPAERAEHIVATLFATLTKALGKDSSVDVRSLGTFSLQVADPENPVSFTPTPQLADDINAPFAFFSPVPLADDLTPDDLLQTPSEEEIPVEEAPEEVEVIETEPDAEPVAEEPVLPAEPPAIPLPPPFQPVPDPEPTESPEPTSADPEPQIVVHQVMTPWAYIIAAITFAIGIALGAILALILR